jgi:hypothetical protein
MADRQSDLTRDRLAVAYTLFWAWIDEEGAISRTERPSGKETE